MQAYAHMMKISFIAYIRDKSALFWGIAFPIMLMLLIGVAFGGEQSFQATVSFVAAEQDGGAEGEAGWTAQLGDSLEEVEAVRLVRETEEEGLAALRNGERTVVLVVPGGTPPLTLTAYYDETRPDVAQAAMGVIGSFIAQANQQALGVNPPFVLQGQGISPSAQGMDIFDFLLPGVIAMTVMFTGLQGLTWSVTDLRGRLVLKRLLTTSAHPATMLGGLLSRYAAVDVFQAIIIFAVGTLVFGATVIGSYGAILAVIILGSITFVAMGMAISTVSETAEGANSLGSFIGFPMLFMSGVFWPVEMMPEAVQPIIAAMPLTHLVDVLRDVTVFGDGLLDHLPSLGYLLLWGAAAVAISIWRFRWE